jgi:DNA-3-methyladenine glycosylase
MTVSQPFFDRETTVVARDLLGCHLVHETLEGVLIGKIVETEAYLGASDAASHSFRGITNRTRVMVEPPGKSYIYFTYGMHYCFNVTTAPQGAGGAVLIRAVEPIEGVELMKARRNILDEKNLANGPAKLVVAMGISMDLYGHDLTQKPLYILSRDHFNQPEFEIIESTRVGISQAKELLLRFYIKGNPFISRK